MSEGGIIQNLQERRQIEAAIQALGDATTEAELIAMAQDLVGRFPPEGLVGAVLRHLGEANSQLRGGLGHLCALLPPEMIAAAARGRRQPSTDAPRTRQRPTDSGTLPG